MHALAELVAWVRQLVPAPDLIVYAGDDLDRFWSDEGENYWAALAACAPFGLVAVAGNDDDPTFTPPIEGPGVTDLGARSLRIGDFVVHGVPGAESTPHEPGIGYLLRRPQAILRDVRRRQVRLRGRTQVLVSHSPPRDVLDGARRFRRGDELEPIGSRAVRRIVEETPALRLVCCGHCHLQGGQDAQLGQATIVNAASHDHAGAKARVALVELTHDGVTDVTWHALKLARGFEGITDIGSARARRLHDAGITTAQALAAADPRAIGPVLGWSPRAAVAVLARAHAVVCGEPVVFRPLALPRGPRLLVDIETDLAQHRVWIVGLLDEATDEFVQLVAHRDRDEPALLEALSTELVRRGRPVVTWSGTRFDERVLCAAYGRHQLMPESALVEAEDAMIAAKRCVALPVPKWTLDAVSTWCGFRFRHPELDGWQIGALCTGHRRGGTPPPEPVLRYNEDDVWALSTILGRRRPRGPRPDDPRRLAGPPRPQEPTEAPTAAGLTGAWPRSSPKKGVTPGGHRRVPRVGSCLVSP